MAFPPNSPLSLFGSLPLLVSSRAQAQGRQPFPLSQGEIVRATITNVRPGSGLVTMSVKGRALEFQTSQSFRPGETVTFQVDKLHPRLHLRFLGGPEVRTALPGAFSGQLRLYPQALLRLFSGAETVIRSDAMNVLVRVLGKQDADRMLPLLRSLVFTRHEASGGFQFRDYLERLGLLMENQLARAGQHTWGQGTAARTAGENLKAFLLMVEAKLAASGERVPPMLLNFISSSLKAVETCQVVNSLLGDQEKSFLFQIPLALAERIELTHIFITLDDSSREGGDGKEKKAVVNLFIDMDILGPLAVRAEMVSGTIDCVITCEKPESVLFLEPLLDELREGLEKADLTVGRIACREGRQRFVADAVEEVFDTLSRFDAVDVTA